jgi:hypothetical protein
LAPYLVGLCMSPFLTTFAIIGLWATTKKMYFLFYQCAGGPEDFVRWLPRAGCRMAPLHVLKVCDLEGWAYPRSHQIFSVCFDILHFLDIQLLEFKFELWIHQYTSNVL